MSVTKTIDQAHYEADCSLVCTRWYKELLLQSDPNANVVDANARILAAQQRVADLTAQQVPPADTQVIRDEFFQAHMDDMTDAEERLDIIANDATLGPILYPGEDPAEAAIGLALIQQNIAALALVWSP